jgi:ArsR family transcriptional regulator
MRVQYRGGTVVRRSWPGNRTAASRLAAVGADVDERATLKIAKALADSTRFQILRAIAECAEISCGELAARFPIAQPTVSHHLKVLTECGLVSVRREGQHSFFRLEPDALAGFRDALGVAFATTAVGAAVGR